MAALLQLPYCLLSEMETCKSHCPDIALGCQHESSPAWDMQLSQRRTDVMCWQWSRDSGSHGCGIMGCRVTLYGHMHKDQQPQQLLSNECSMLPPLPLSLTALAEDGGHAAELCFHAVCLCCCQEFQQLSVANCRREEGAEGEHLPPPSDSSFIYGLI